jgi:hypothetical protein
MVAALQIVALGRKLLRAHPHQRTRAEHHFVDFEIFRPDRTRAVRRSDGSKGGRPAFDTC